MDQVGGVPEYPEAMSRFAIFETAVGECGIAWSERGVTGFQLPESDGASTRRRMQRRFAGVEETAPPVNVQQSIDAIVSPGRIVRATS